MGINADATALQSKTLNTSRGPAVHATRTQCAKREYSWRMQSIIGREANLTVIEDTVFDLIVTSSDESPRDGLADPGKASDPMTTSNGCDRDDGCTSPFLKPGTSNSENATCTVSNSTFRGRCIGVETVSHGPIFAQSIVITAGTTLRGRIWIGKDSQESGGDGRPAVNKFSLALERIGFTLIRLKTGTPPRLKASSCDFSKCLRQDGVTPRPLFHMEQRTAESISAAPSNNPSTTPSVSTPGCTHGARAEKLSFEVELSFCSRMSVQAKLR